MPEQELETSEQEGGTFNITHGDIDRYAVTPDPTEPGHVVFNSGDVEMLRIAPEGLYAMGELACDSGQVYAAMMRFLHNAGFWPWPIDFEPRIINLNEDVEGDQDVEQGAGVNSNT